MVDPRSMRTCSLIVLTSMVILLLMNSGPVHDGLLIGGDVPRYIDGDRDDSSDPKARYLPDTLIMDDAELTFYAPDDFDAIAGPYGNSVYFGGGLYGGDIDNDGFEDLIVGVPGGDGQNNMAWDCGEVHIVWGGRQGPPPQEIDGPQEDLVFTIYGMDGGTSEQDPGDALGWSVACGDIDNDGHDDIVMGAPYANSRSNNRLNAGEVAVVFGGAREELGDESNLQIGGPDIVIYGAQPGERAGFSVECGDLNGDGFDDIILGRPGASPPGRNQSGITSVIFGDNRNNLDDAYDLRAPIGPPPPGNAVDGPRSQQGAWITMGEDLILEGSADFDGAGYSVATGNVDGDGFEDLIIGAPFYDGRFGAENIGCAYVVKGRGNWPMALNLSASADSTFMGPSPWDYSGVEVACGDMTNDGMDEVVVGTVNGTNLASQNSGVVHVVFGGSSLPQRMPLPDADLIVYGEMGGNFFGLSCDVGDVDGDGYGDLAVSTPYVNEVGFSSGKAYLFFGASSGQLEGSVGAVNADATVGGGVSFYQAGSEVCVLDLDGDGAEDMSILAVAFNGGPQGDRMYASDVGVFFSKPPDIKDISLELVNGWENGTAFCALKDFTFRVSATDILGWEDISSVVLRIDAITPNNPNGADLAFEFDRSTSSFSEISDPLDVAEIHSTSANVSHDDDFLLTLDFNILFDWNFPTEVPVDTMVEVTGELCPVSLVDFNDFITVVKELEFTGTLLLTDDDGKVLGNGSWVKGGGALNIDGLTITYKGYPEVFPPGGEAKVTLSDGNDSWSDEPSAGQSVKVGAMTPTTTQEGVGYSLTISNPQFDQGPGALSFDLNIDSTAPGVPTGPTIHADSDDDPRTEADNDLELFFQWNGSSDVGSGVWGYLYAPTDGGGTDSGTFTLNTSTRVDAMDSETVSLYVWAIDNVGNIGASTGATIIYDTEGVHFDFEPSMSEKEWHNSSSVVCTVKIMDTGGSGVDVDSIQFAISTDGVDEFQQWVSIPHDDEDNSTLTSDVSFTVSNGVVEVMHTVEFDEGKDNYIRYRCMDLAGNGYTLSPSYQVQVDTTSVVYTSGSPNGSVRLLERLQRCIITISDELSGVERDSVMYRFSTTGEEGFGEWSRSGLTQDMSVPSIGSSKWQVEVMAEKGDGNKIQWWASDEAGNWDLLSPVYTLWVNRAPVPSIDSPTSQMELRVGEPVLLSAMNSMDPDNDTLTYNWSSDIQGYLGSGVELQIELEQGTHTIKLEISDGYERVETSKQFNVTGGPEEGGSGGGGDEPISFMEASGNWWFVLLIFVIIILSALVMFFYLRSRRPKEAAPPITEDGVVGDIGARESSYSEIIYSPSGQRGTRRPAVAGPGIATIRDGAMGPHDPITPEGEARHLTQTSASASDAPLLQLPPSSRDLPLDLDPKEKLKLLETQLLKGWITQDLYVELNEKFKKELIEMESKEEGSKVDITGMSGLEVEEREGDETGEHTFKDGIEDGPTPKETRSYQEIDEESRMDELDEIFRS